MYISKHGTGKKSIKVYFYLFTFNLAKQLRQKNPGDRVNSV
jgi:hypothetical protein